MIPRSAFWRISKAFHPQSYSSLSEFFTMPDQPAATVYFDGSCPLCRAEIALYRRQAKGDALCFADASNPATPLGDGLDRQRAMRRFHVRKKDGSLVSGAAAFVEVWKRLPQWRWAARAGSLPGMPVVLETAYKLFLVARPVLAQLFAVLSTRVRAAPHPHRTRLNRSKTFHEIACYRSEPRHRA